VPPTLLAERSACWFLSSIGEVPARPCGLYDSGVLSVFPCVLRSFEPTQLHRPTHEAGLRNTTDLVSRATCYACECTHGTVFTLPLCLVACIGCI
jgi:hypothetical protein